MKMEMKADVVIVGAGISGLSTALGLHRLGVESLVLECWEDLRVTGFGVTAWSNAWKALDILGVGDQLRLHSLEQEQLIISSTIHGKVSSQTALVSSSERDYETRCLERRVLVETMANELPKGSIRFSSKVISIEESDHHLKLLRLEDGSTIKAKVLIGCDGINSIVAQWLGFKKPTVVEKSVIRGFVRTPIEPCLMQFMGDKIKYGMAPITANSLYWYFLFIPSIYNDEELEQNPEKMKNFMLSNLGKTSEKVREVMEKTKVRNVACSRLKLRSPWEVLWGNISKENVCALGDAVHPMMPNIGQGACSSLEDGIVLARCLGRAMLGQRDGEDEETEYERIKTGLEEFAKERRWRIISLMTIAYGVAFIEQGTYKVLQLLRDNVLASSLNAILLKLADYNFGRLV